MHEWLLKSLPEALTRTISRTPCYSLIPPYQGNPIWVIRVKSVGDLCGRTAEGERMTVAQNLLLLHFSQPFTQPAPYPNTRTHSSFFFCTAHLSYTTFTPLLFSPCFTAPSFSSSHFLNPSDGSEEEKCRLEGKWREEVVRRVKVRGGEEGGGEVGGWRWMEVVYELTASA